MGRIVWLASYPKSGNTWVRVFLTTYQRGAHEPVDINRLEVGIIASSRPMFDDETGVEASDLTAEEVEHYRPHVYSHISDVCDATLFIKVHDAFTVGDRGPMFPARATARAIYLVRNPLDVVVSFAEHSGVSVNEAIDRVCNGYALAAAGDCLPEQLPQRLLSWNDHVASWMDQKHLPIIAVRYEDLLADPINVFGAIVAAIDLPFSIETVARAVDLSRFEVLREMEQESGFRERPPRATVFFRQGRSGGWQESLERDQIARIVSSCRVAMERFGYLDADGEPVAG